MARSARRIAELDLLQECDKDLTVELAIEPRLPQRGDNFAADNPRQARHVTGIRWTPMKSSFSTLSPCLARHHEDALELEFFCADAVRFIPVQSLLWRLEGRPWDLTLPDDGKKSTDLQLGVIGNRDSHGTGSGIASLHDYVASSSPNFSEAVLLEDLAHFASGENAKSTHAPRGIALRRYVRADVLAPL